MSSAARDELEEQFRQDAMAEAHRQTVWREFCEARAFAAESDDIAAGLHAQKLYMRWLRLGLTDPERRAVEAENRVAQLMTEVRLLREQLGRRSIPVPQWRDSPATDPTGSGKP